MNLNDYKSKLNYKIAPYCEIMLKSTKRLEEPQSEYYDVRDASRRQKHLENDLKLLCTGENTLKSRNDE